MSFGSAGNREASLGEAFLLGKYSKFTTDEARGNQHSFQWISMVGLSADGVTEVVLVFAGKIQRVGDKSTVKLLVVVPERG